MNVWTAPSLRAVTGGSWLRRPVAAENEPLASSLSTDTRHVAAGEAFLALRGERFDAHDFLDSAASAGASLLIVDRPERVPESLLKSPAGPAVLRVADTRRALGQIAGAHRRTLEGTKVIAVVGSNGKTTTAQLIHSVLSTRLRGSVSQKSFNNDVGVPVTILAAKGSDQYLICEVGSNHPGETSVLSRIVQPDIVVVTCVGRDHVEFFPDLAAVAREHASIFVDLRPGGAVIAPAGDPYISDYLRPVPHVVTFGAASDADLRLSDYQATATGGRLTINERWTVDLPLLGRHNAMNALAAAAVGKRFGLDEDSIARGLSAAMPADMRLNRRTVHGIELLVDCYNSNPDSLAAAMHTFASIAPDSSRRVLVLGDMLETGAQSAVVHREALEMIARSCPARAVVLVGDAFIRAGEVLGRLLPGAPVLALPSVDHANAARLAELVRPGDRVLLKGSRGIRLERLITLLERAGAAKPQSVQT